MRVEINGVDVGEVKGLVVMTGGRTREVGLGFMATPPCVTGTIKLGFMPLSPSLMATLGLKPVALSLAEQIAMRAYVNHVAEEITRGL